MADMITYTCPNCGGKLEFNPGTQQMKCPYCDTLLDIEALQKAEEESKAAEEDSFNWKTDEEFRTWDDNEDMQSYTCTSCGGEIICQGTLAATKCPFCDSPVILDSKFKGKLKPDLIIPFKFDKSQAISKMNTYLEGKKLLPDSFKKENKIEDIRGIYVPFWLYDAEVYGRAGYNANRVRTWSDNEYDHKQVDWFYITRAADISFKNIPVDSSENIDNDITESLEPYDLKEALDFNSAFLSGYLAEKYGEDKDKVIYIAKDRIKTSTDRLLRDTVGPYDMVSPVSSHVHVDNTGIKYALYPVWLLNTSWKGEKFTFAMNGQTGKFVGNLPVDKGKRMKLLISRFFLFTVIVYILYTLVELILR